jgi:hypothetical protein
MARAVFIVEKLAQPEKQATAIAAKVTLKGGLLPNKPPYGLANPLIQTIRTQKWKSSNPHGSCLPVTSPL